MSSAVLPIVLLALRSWVWHRLHKCSSRDLWFVPYVQTQETYMRFFKLIEDKLKISMSTFQCDYELAVMHAVSAIFPNVKISGCQYHFSKAIWKNSSKYQCDTTKDGKTFTRITTNLPWQWLRQLDTNVLGVVHAEHRHRTNNPLEGVHHRLNVRIPKKPNFYNILNKIKKEASFFDYRAKKILLRPNNKHRRMKDCVIDRKYLKLLKKLENNEVSNLNFLKKIKKFINLKISHLY